MDTPTETHRVGAPARPGSVAPTVHRPFALVLAGGGARGLAHTGVLRALEHAGLVPAAGVRAVRAQRAELAALLASPAPVSGSV